MKTLNQIKTEVAQGHGYGTFYETGLDTDMIDDIAKLYAQSAIDEIKEKIAEESRMMKHDHDSGEKLRNLSICHDAGFSIKIDKESIRSVTIELK